jgi:hypothetical protein
VRIYSHSVRCPQLIPTPYQIFRFDGTTGVLSALSSEDAQPYVIHNYK